MTSRRRNLLEGGALCFVAAGALGMARGSPHALAWWIASLCACVAALALFLRALPR